MNDRRDALFAGLAALALAAPSGRLEADAVNRLGIALGLDNPKVLTAVEALKGQDLIEIHWGPALSLTAKGRARAMGEPATASGVTIHAGGTYVGGSVGPGANVGTGAGTSHSTVAVGSTVSGVPAGLLAAALIQLQELLAGLPEAAQAPAEALEKELTETAAAAVAAGPASPAGAGSSLARIGDGVRRSTELLGQVEQAGGRLASVGGLLKNTWDAISPHLPTIGS